MGNRAVICSHNVNKKNKDKHVGIYLHWCGGQESVARFLQMAKDKGLRGCDYDPDYCWARLCQIIGDDFSQNGNNDVSLGVGIVSRLGYHNYDNGTYYIDDEFNIVKHTDGSELD